MNSLFTIQLWLILLGRILKATHPLTFGLALFQLWTSRARWRSTIETPYVRLVSVFFLVDLAIRLLTFFGGVKYQTRYFLVLTVGMTILAGAGALNLVSLLALKLKIPLLRPPRLLVMVLGIIFAFNTGKALIPRWDSAWFVEIPLAIKASCPENRKPVLVSMSTDPRFAYYANAEYFRISQEEDLSKEAKFFLVDDSGATTPLTKEAFSNGVRLLPDSTLLASFDQHPFVERLELDMAGEHGQFVVHAQLFNRREATATRLPHNDNWKKLYEGDNAWIAVPPCRFNGFKISLSEKSPPVTLKGVGFFSTPPWTIMTMDLTGENYWETWTPKKGTIGGIEHLRRNITELGGSNVFILTTIEDSLLRKQLSDKKLHINLTLLKSFRDNKNRPLCLYQGSDS